MAVVIRADGASPASSVTSTPRKHAEWRMSEGKRMRTLGRSRSGGGAWPISWGYGAAPVRGGVRRRGRAGGGGSVCRCAPAPAAPAAAGHVALSRPAKAPAARHARHPRGVRGLEHAGWALGVSGPRKDVSATYLERVRNRSTRTMSLTGMNRGRGIATGFWRGSGGAKFPHQPLPRSGERKDVGGAQPKGIGSNSDKCE